MKKLTDAEIKAEADNVIEQFYKGESRASAFGLGFVTGADWVQKQLLQQTQCSTLRAKIEQELNRLTTDRDQPDMYIDDKVRLDVAARKLQWVLSLMDELQPVA